MDAQPELYHLPGFYEPFSAISHLFGAMVFLVLGCFLLRRGRGSLSRLIYLGIYVFSGVLLLSMSGVYHMLPSHTVGRTVLHRLDHGAIFVLIAGTFTPVHGILFRGLPRWLPLLLIWSAAVTGITLKSVFFDDLPHWLGLALYLALGWLGVISGIMVAQKYGLDFVKPALWGGFAYSIGGLADFVQWGVVMSGVVHAHEIFHVAVLAGLLLQFQFIWRIAAVRQKTALPLQP